MSLLLLAFDTYCDGCCWVLPRKFGYDFSAIDESGVAVEKAEDRSAAMAEDCSLQALPVYVHSSDTPKIPPPPSAFLPSRGHSSGVLASFPASPLIPVCIYS